MVLSHPRGHIAIVPEVEPRCPRSLAYMFKEEKDTANDYCGLSATGKTFCAWLWWSTWLETGQDCLATGKNS